jgi:four helix bundle protein
MDTIHSVNFTDLKCWQKSRLLARITYEQTRSVKDFNIRDQLRRATLSIMNNIAEGYTRRSEKETFRFLNISIASCAEVISMTYHLEDIRFLDNDKLNDIRDKAIELSKMINGLANYVKTKTREPGKQGTRELGKYESRKVGN